MHEARTFWSQSHIYKWMTHDNAQVTRTKKYAQKAYKHTHIGCIGAASERCLLAAACPMVIIPFLLFTFNGWNIHFGFSDGQNIHLEINHCDSGVCVLCMCVRQVIQRPSWWKWGRLNWLLSVIDRIEFNSTQISYFKNSFVTVVAAFIHGVPSLWQSDFN